MNKIFISICCLFFSCKQASHKNSPNIIISTNFGDINATLYPDKAPKTVAAFLQYIDSGYYKNAQFYRVVLQEGLSSSSNAGIIQGGTWLTAKEKTIAGIPHESTQLSGLTHKDGTLSLARTAPGTAGTEFFICIGDQSQYDFGNAGVGDKQGYAAFGKVTSGMDVVRKIQEQRSNGENFTEKILIKNIERD